MLLSSVANGISRAVYSNHFVLLPLLNGHNRACYMQRIYMAVHLMRCVKRMSSHTLFTFAKFKLRATEKLAPVSNGTTMGSKACKENKPARSSVLAKPPLSMDLMREKQASFVKESDGVKSQIIPLKCPLTMTRIRIPVRFMSCKHLSCFDLDSYIAAETNKSTQKCPICNCTGSPSALRMCGFTYWMLEHNPDCTHYELTSDFIRPVDKGSLTPSDNGSKAISIEIS